MTMPVWRQYRPPRKEIPLVIAVLLYFTGENAILRTALPYITFGVCRDFGLNTSVDLCQRVSHYPDDAMDVQEYSVLFFMAERMTSTLPALLLTALCGCWSLKYGPRAPFLLAYLGQVLSVVCFVLAFHLQNVPVLVLLGGGFFLKAVTAHNLLLQFTSFRYVAGIVHSAGGHPETAKGGLECQTLLEDKKRDVRDRTTTTAEEEEEEDFLKQGLLLAGVWRLQATESLGVALGSALSWLCQKGGGVLLAFLVGAGVSVLGVLVVVCWFKGYRYLNFQTDTDDTTTLRTRGKKSETALSSQKLGPVVTCGCLFTWLLTAVYRSGFTALIVPYLQQPPLSWPRISYSAFTACSGLVRTLFLIFLAPFLRDHTVVVVALVLATAGGVWTGFSTSMWSMLVAGSLSLMVDSVFPALMTTLCRQIHHNQIRQILLKMSVVEVASTLVGPPVFVEIYTHTQDYFSGLVFLITATIPLGVLLAGAAVEVCRNVGSTPSEKDQPPEPPQLEARDASRRPDYTQSMDVLRPVVRGCDCMWRSAEW